MPTVTYEVVAAPRGEYNPLRFRNPAGRVA